MIRKIGLFFLSLWLLFILVIIITIDIPYCYSNSCSFIGFNRLFAKNIIPITCLVALLIGAFSYYDFQHQVSGTPELSFKITKVEPIDYEHLTFLTTYIIPLIGFNFDEIKFQIVFFILLVVIGIIYIKTDLFYANPTLAIFQYRLYKVDGNFRKNEKRTAKILITKDRLNIDDNVKYVKLDERIYYAFKVKNNE